MSSAQNTGNTGALIRSELWQRQLEEILHEQLTGVPFVRQLDFPDGSAFTIPSIGTAVVRNLPEDVEVTFDSLDTGEIQITMADPVVSATSVSEVLLEDSLWSSEIMSTIPVEHAAAIMERYETDVLALANSTSGGQDDPNDINGISHRVVGSGTNEVMAPADFAYAGYAMKKAKIPSQNMLAIVDPSVAYALETTANLVNVSNNPRWEGIIETGITQNMRFVRNIYGWDVFESNMLADANETISATTGNGGTTTAGKANIFTTVGRESLLPFVVAWRRRPTMDRDFDFKKRQEQIVTTARWGIGVTREDNLVVILTDTDQV